MVTDEQVRRLRQLSNTEKNQEIAASKAGMDPGTARRYLGLERLPSELRKERLWRTREDPFGEVWDAVQRQIQESPGLEAKTLFDWLQREYPGRFSDLDFRGLYKGLDGFRFFELVRTCVLGFGYGDHAQGSNNSLGLTLRKELP